MTDRPRVLLVSAVPDFKGGAEVVMHRMLANPHITPVLAAPEDGPLAEAARAMRVPVCFYNPTAMLRVHRPPRPGPILNAAIDAVRCALRLRRLARQHGCAIIHSNGLKPHMLCAILGTRTRAKTLVHLHDIPYRPSERLIWRTIASQVSRVVMVSRPCFPGEILPSNAEIVPNGIPMLRDQVPVERLPGPPRLGFVGRFTPNKGLDLLLDWFQAARRAGLDTILSIRGRPDPDAPDYWDRIRARIRDEGLEPFVRLDGWVTGEATYADLDILLVPSKTPDPLPLVVLEAMSAGVIVAGYPSGGVPSMIEDGRTGLLVSDGEEFASRLGALLADPGRLYRMRLDAHERVRTEFGLPRFYERLLAVYRSILQPDAASR